MRPSLALATRLAAFLMSIPNTEKEGDQDADGKEGRRCSTERIPPKAEPELQQSSDGGAERDSDYPDKMDPACPWL